jgi:hypothetical protein
MDAFYMHQRAGIHPLIIVKFIGRCAMLAPCLSYLASLVIPLIRNTRCSIALFFPSRPRFIPNPWAANVVVIYSSKALVIGSLFVSPDLHIYYWVVC